MAGRMSRMSDVLYHHPRTDILRLYPQAGAVITTIQKWGNSQGLRLNKDLLSAARLEIGDAVDVELREGAITITPARRTRGGHDLRSMVRRIPKGYKPAELDWGSPTGREVW